MVFYLWIPFQRAFQTKPVIGKHVYLCASGCVVIIHIGTKSLCFPQFILVIFNL